MNKLNYIYLTFAYRESNRIVWIILINGFVSSETKVLIPLSCYFYFTIFPNIADSIVLLTGSGHLVLLCGHQIKEMKKIARSFVNMKYAY